MNEKEFKKLKCGDIIRTPFGIIVIDSLREFRVGEILREILRHTLEHLDIAAHAE